MRVIVEGQDAGFVDAAGALGSEGLVLVRVLEVGLRGGELGLQLLRLCLDGEEWLGAGLEGLRLLLSPGLLWLLELRLELILILLEERVRGCLTKVGIRRDRGLLGREIRSASYCRRHCLVHVNIWIVASD